MPLIIDYARIAAAALPRALNDHGDLGIMTQCIISAQANAHGHLPLALSSRIHKHFDHPLPLRHLSLLWNCGIFLHLRSLGIAALHGDRLWQALTALRGPVLPAFQTNTLRPLWALGIHSLLAIVAMDATSNRLATLPSDRLHEAVDPHVWRKTSTAKMTCARLALNRLALLLSGAGPEEAAKFNGKDALPLEQRGVHLVIPARERGELQDATVSGGGIRALGGNIPAPAAPPNARERERSLQRPPNRAGY